MSIILDEDGRGPCCKCGRNQVLIDDQCQLCDLGFTLKEVNLIELKFALDDIQRNPLE